MNNNEYQRGYDKGKVRGRLESLLAAAIAAGFFLFAWYLPKLIIYLNRDW